MTEQRANTDKEADLSANVQRKEWSQNFISTMFYHLYPLNTRNAQENITEKLTKILTVVISS